jgi:hypothetical protein
MPEPDRQPPLPTTGYCWRCANRRVLAVGRAAVASTSAATRTVAARRCNARSRMGASRHQQMPVFTVARAWNSFDATVTLVAWASLQRIPAELITR